MKNEDREAIRFHVIVYALAIAAVLLVGFATGFKGGGGGIGDPVPMGAER